MIDGKWKGHSILDYNDCESLEDMKRLYTKRQNATYDIAAVVLGSDHPFSKAHYTAMNADNVDTFLYYMCISHLEAIKIDFEDFKRKLKEPGLFLENGHQFTSI